jgi:hypothetical protein
LCLLLLIWMLVKMITTPHNLPFRGVPEDLWATPIRGQG